MRVWGRACGVAVAWLACAVRAQPAPVDLGDLFLAAARWEMKADAFLESYQGAGFRFVDGRQTALSTQRDALRFLGLDVYEARVYFSAEGLRRVEVSLYNKGDAGIKDKTSFDALSDAVKAKLTGRLQEAGMTGRTSSDRPNYVVRRHQWVKRSPGVLLEWAYVEPHRSGGKNMPYSAEFIKEPDGKWRIWHLKWWRTFRTNFYKSWVDDWQNIMTGPAHEHDWKVEPCTFFHPYDSKTERWPFPLPPEPYETYEGNMMDWAFGGEKYKWIRDAYFEKYGTGTGAFEYAHGYKPGTNRNNPSAIR